MKAKQLTPHSYIPCHASRPWLARFFKFCLPVLWFVSGVWLTACGANDNQIQTTPKLTEPPVVLLVVTPAVITAKLTPTATLLAASQQVATALDVPPAAVRVRIKLNCIVCEIDNAKDKTSIAGLSVSDAATQLQPNTDLWLFVQNFTCAYHFDGEKFAPKSCQFAPL